ncbi:MAG TPA: ATP-binding protein [Humidesulfovibrio sp.]|uniref:ATP-binding protein n=1 Tax=Humidesulfovibrio sp. TaxID=2910988 RepID=UPI002D02EBA3|nr:ATP-binding protein [Humidesulfovibrio sp.]HWR03065.1 ATP-binding protein [Humidesulfovibrio sp.]
MSLRLKTVLGIALIESVLLCFIIWHGLNYLAESNTAQLDKRVRTVAELFAAANKAEVLALDLATLESSMDVLAAEPGFVFARISSAARGVLAQRGEEPSAELGVRKAKALIAEEAIPLGWLEVGFTDASIAETVRLARRNALAMSAAGILASALFSAVLGFYLTRQLSRLTQASEEIAAGNLGHRIPVRGGDELAKVSQAFNHMTEELDRSHEHMEERIRARTEELAKSNENLIVEMAERRQAHRDISQILSAVSAMLVSLDVENRVRRINQAAEHGFGLREAQALGRPLEELGLAWKQDEVAEALARCRETRAPVKAGPLGYTRQDGHQGFLMLSASPLLGETPDAPLEGMLLLLDDITEMRTLEVKLAHAQKLESIGQLAAGIAHEINTPTQYVGDSVAFLKNAFSDLLGVIHEYATLAEGNACATPEEYAARKKAVHQALEALDYEFLMEEVPKTFDMIQDGIERVRSIVLAMRRFAHPGDGTKKAVDLNQAMENTVTVSRNEWKHVADLVTDFAPDLPLVLCQPGEVNQVLLGLVVNAAHAIGDAVAGTLEKGRITLRTRQEGAMAVLSITDTGTGIPEAVRPRIFDPFFTTKQVGRGTGQGLTIAYDIVVNKNGGSITFETETGRGTTFHVRLPISGA